MKTIQIILTLCCLFLLSNWSFAQKNYIDAADFEKSLKTWEEGKAAHQNSYEFSLVKGSFSGYTATTTFTVVEGILVKRSFNEILPDSAGGNRKGESWVETEDKINSHESGEKWVTMDQIYAYAKNYVGKETPKKEKAADENEITDGIVPPKLDISVFFSTEYAGIISLVGSRPNGCMDDCFSGYRVVGFKWLDANKKEKTSKKKNKKKK